MYRKFFKPLFDKFFAIILLILLSPIILVVSILIYIKMGRPILFTQSRPTQNEKIFKIYKFRTMSNERDRRGELLSDEQRLRGVGRVIRALSLDEIPQLWNVLKGDMSFIGPRPLLIEYLKLYSSEQKRRHLVKAGITGLAQVNGRNAISWEEKFRYDIEYVDNISFWLDMKILYLTILKVLKRDGISQDGVATAEKFKGNKS